MSQNKVEKHFWYGVQELPYEINQYWGKFTELILFDDFYGARTMDESPDWYDAIDLKQTFSAGDIQDLEYLYALMSNA